MLSGEMPQGKEKSGKLSFLDLAAELRNNIYELALVHDRAGGRIANVALLRVSRQVYQEAKPLLHAQTKLQIKLFPETKQSERACRIEGDIHGRVDGDRPLHTLAILWPSCVKHVRSISVLICFSGVSAYGRIPNTNFGIINKVLYSLVCAIRTAPKSKTYERTMDVNIWDTPLHHVIFSTEYPTLEKVFYPLAKVPRDIKLELDSYFLRIEENHNKLRMDDIQDLTLQFDAVEANREVFEPFEIALRRANSKYLSGTETQASKRVIFHTDALEEAKRIMGHHIIDLDSERTLEACHIVMSKAIAAVRDEVQPSCGDGARDEIQGGKDTGRMVTQGPKPSKKERRSCASDGT